MSLVAVLGNEFASWLHEGGVQILKVSPAYLEEGWRGVVAEGDILPGEAILRVPKRLLISVPAAFEMSLLPLCLRTARCPSFFNRGIDELPAV
eukprot:jgi/Botrbrau1/15892/Bobra.40_1s0075.1